MFIYKLLSFILLPICRWHYSNWFQKPTSSNRSINYFSNQPICQKKNIVYNLVDRAISLFHKMFDGANLKIVKQILFNNDYPNSFIDKNIKIRMNKIKYSSPNSLNEKNRSDSDIIFQLSLWLIKLWNQ